MNGLGHSLLIKTNSVIGFSHIFFVEDEFFSVLCEVAEHSFYKQHRFWIAIHLVAVLQPVAKRHILGV